MEGQGTGDRDCTSYAMDERREGYQQPEIGGY